MDTRVIDLAISEGRHAARRIALRFKPMPKDQVEVIGQAGARIEYALTEWGHGPAATEEARAIMVDAYEAELVRLKDGGQAHV